MLIQISPNEWFNTDHLLVKSIQVKPKKDCNKAYVVISTDKGEYWSNPFENVYIARSFANSFAVKLNSLERRD